MHLDGQINWRRISEASAFKSVRLGAFREYNAHTLKENSSALT